MNTDKLLAQNLGVIKYNGCVVTVLITAKQIKR